MNLNDLPGVLPTQPGPAGADPGPARSALGRRRPDQTGDLYTLADRLEHQARDRANARS